MFNFINIFTTNMTVELKNYTDEVYYGVTSNNILFYVTPDENDNGSIKNFIYINSFNKTDKNVSFMSMPNYNFSTYSPPYINYPVYISELNCVLFVSEEERNNTIDRYGSGKKLVETYASKLIPLMNGSYKVTVSLSQKPYYTIINKEIHQLPIASKEYIQEAMINHNLTKEMLETSDIFIIETILRNALTNKANVVNHELKIIRKDKINDREPIIFGNSGLILFSNIRACEIFIENYNGDLDDYIIQKALNTVEKDHNKEIEDIIIQTKRDKKSIVETFMIMGGTSLGSLLVENIIKLIIEKYNKKDNKNKSKITDILPASLNKNTSTFLVITSILTVSTLGIIYLNKKKNESIKNDLDIYINKCNKYSNKIIL